VIYFKIFIILDDTFHCISQKFARLKGNQGCNELWICKAESKWIHVKQHVFLYHRKDV